MNISQISFQGKIKATYKDLNNNKVQTEVVTTPKNDRILLDFLNNIGIYNKRQNLTPQQGYFCRIIANSSHEDLNIPNLDAEVQKRITVSFFNTDKKDKNGQVTPDLWLIYRDISQPKEPCIQTIEFEPDKDVYEKFQRGLEG